MAAHFLCLARRHIAISPAGLLSMLLAMDANFVATIMVTVMIMTHMHAVIAVMVPVAVVPFIVVIFGEQRSA